MRYSLNWRVNLLTVCIFINAVLAGVAAATSDWKHVGWSVGMAIWCFLGILVVEWLESKAQR